MKTVTQFKDEALTSLEGNWGRAALLTLIMILIFQIPSLIGGRFGVSYPTDDGIITSGTLGIIIIFLLPLSWGYYVQFLDLLRGRKLEYVDLFSGFKDYGRILGTLLLMSIYILLWSILLIIPGIIKQYSYAMTYYILKDNPDMKYNSAIEMSIKMMKGKKMKLFLIDLSLIGWLILSFLTLGIGFLFLSPYRSAIYASFYEEIKPKEEHSVEIVEE